MAAVSLKGLASRFFAKPRAVAAVAVVGLAVTSLASAFFPASRAFGSVVFVPWVALFAFPFGVLAGIAAAGVGFVAFLVPIMANGSSLTIAFVSGRLLSFLVVGAGVGALSAQLRVSERRSRALVEGLPLAMYVEREGRGLTYVGPQIADLTGYSPAEWLATPGLWRRALHADDRERVVASYDAAVAARRPFTSEYRLVEPSGDIVWVRDSSTFVAERAGGYRQGFIVEITAQKHAEAQLKGNGQLMRGLIDSTIDGICLTDLEGRILIANKPLRRLVAELGIPTEGAVHERLIALAQKTTEPERFLAHMQELTTEAMRPSFAEFELNDQRVFQGFTAPALGGDGECVGRIWTLREVTSERELDRLRDAFVATVSHELRTPLTSIVGFVELIGTGANELDPEDAGYLEIVRRNVDRLRHMVDDLLMLAQIDSHRLTLKIEQCDLVALARAALGSARPLADAREIDLTLTSRGPAVIAADPTRVGEVLDNLVSNAIKFTPSGGRVVVEIDATSEECTFQVSDTGMGIPKAEQPRLFERFFRSSNAAAAHTPGTGLGLAIAKAIVEAHDGTITFESTEGTGTTFRVILPTDVGNDDGDELFERPGSQESALRVAAHRAG